MIRTLAVLTVLISGPVFGAEPVVSTVTQDALVERQQKADRDLVVLDVRTPEEFVSGHVPGALNVPHDQLEARMAEVPQDKDIVLYCQSGRRAGIAANTLASRGYTRLGHLEGDMPAWKAAGRPVERPADAAACVAALTGGRLGVEQACAAP